MKFRWLTALPKSVVVGAATPLCPETAARYVDALRAEVSAQGRQFTQPEAAYAPVGPPPFFWEYRCDQCFFWRQGLCEIVEGEIKPAGWCSFWTPPEMPEKPFSWIGRLKARLKAG